MTRDARHIVLAVVGAAAACGGSVPQTRYYQLAAPAAAATQTAAGSVIAVDALASDGAYDDERIVYRTDPVRLDYYAYHRWSAAPGVMITSYLQQALASTGKFRAVVREATTSTAVVLGGRVVALEEVDLDKTHWVGHVAIELTLGDAKTGDVLWAHTYDQREPLAEQSPEGLARAIGVAMQRIVGVAAPTIVEVAAQRALAAQSEDVVGHQVAADRARIR